MKSPAPKRPRTAWFINVTKVEETCDLCIVYKNSKGDIRPFSSSNSNAKVKIPWGTPVKCEFLRTREGDETFGEFEFTGKKEVVKLKASELYSFGGEVNPFSRRISSMIVDKREVLLAAYLSLLPHTVGFVNYREEVHSPEGFLIDGSGLTKDDLEKIGGSLEEFSDFVKIALGSAKVVRKAADIRQFFEPKKRKQSNSRSTCAKKSKAETIDERERFELTDSDGIEKEYQKSFVGLANIPLENIKISQDLEANINKHRVNRIIESMVNKYDPSISIPVVCPEDGQTVFDLTNVKNQKFVVVQKVHTVAAFKELDKEGKFNKLISHRNRTVPCYVLRISSSGLIHYGNQRANNIQYEFSRKTVPQDLLRTFQSLRLKDGEKNSLETVERMAKLARIGPNECCALRKLCNWSTTASTALMLVINQYERYETLDVKQKGHQGRLSRGEKMTIPNVLFKQLGMLDESYFLSVHNKILTDECSLKACVVNFQEFMEVDKVASALTIISGYDKYDSIIEENPGKFEVDLLKPFIGAEVTKDGQKNLKAVMLEKYYEAVIAGDSECSDDNVKYVEVAEIDNLLKNDNVLDDFETLIVQVEEEKNKSLVLELAKSRALSEKDFHATVITFPSEDVQFEALSLIRNLKVKKQNFKILPLLFNCKPFIAGDIAENVKFGILFGIFSVLVPPLNIYYSSISNLHNIVENISPPCSTVAFISDIKVPLVKIHCETETLSRKVTYFGSAGEMSKFKTDLQKRSVGEVGVLAGKATQDTQDSEAVICAPDIVSQSESDDNISSTSPFKAYSITVSGKSRGESSSASRSFLDNLDSIGNELIFKD